MKKQKPKNKTRLDLKPSHTFVMKSTGVILTCTSVYLVHIFFHNKSNYYIFYRMICRETKSHSADSTAHLSSDANVTHSLQQLVSQGWALKGEAKRAQLLD